MSNNKGSNNRNNHGSDADRNTTCYEELKMKGLPLYNQGSVQASEVDAFAPKTSPPLDASRTALLIVDVQPEYWSQCPAVRQDFSEFPSRLSALIETCRKQRAKIIWVRADYRYSHSPWLMQFARLHDGKIPSEVESSPHTARWEDFATPQGGEFVIPKTSWSSTSHTNLIELLQQSGIDTVLVCGLITSVCVQHSAFGIFEAGYRTILVTDACADRGRARHDAALALYGDYMYELVTTRQVQETLQGAQPVWLTNAPHKMPPGHKCGGGMVQRMPLSFVQDYVLAGNNSKGRTLNADDDDVSSRTGSLSTTDDDFSR
jgi:nicotinamidase-related amidase